MPVAAPMRDERLLPSSVRAPALGLMVGCSVLALTLAVRYHGDRRAGRVDNWLLGRVPQALHYHAGLLSTLADGALLSVGVASWVLGVIFGLAGRWSLAASAVLGPLLTMVVTETAKRLVDRTIGGGLALPSGHTAGTTSILLVVALVAIGRLGTHVRVMAALLLGCVTAGAAPPRRAQPPPVHAREDAWQGGVAQWPTPSAA